MFYLLQDWKQTKYLFCLCSRTVGGQSYLLKLVVMLSKLLTLRFTQI